MMNLNVENSPVRSLRITWTVLGLLTILTLTAAWWRWLGSPTLAAHDELSRKLLAVQILNEAGPDILRRYDKLQIELADWQAKAENLNFRIQAHENEGQFLKWLHEQANNHGLSIRDYRPGSRLNQNEYDCRSVQLTTQGSYTAVCNFLNQIRIGPRMLRITSLELIPRDESGETYSCNMHLLLYSQSNAAKANIAGES